MTSQKLLLFQIAKPMGSLLAPKDDDIPEIYTYKNYHKIVEETNLISKQICTINDMQITVKENSLHFSYSNWKNSEVRTVLGLFPHETKKMEEGSKNKRNPDYSYLQQIQVTLTLRQLYKIYNALKNYKQNQTNAQIQTTPETPNTPIDLEEDDISCEICFDEQPDMVLPCGHAFGAKCISKYIIEKEEKRCPKCRVIFQCGRSTIQRNLYTIISEEEKGVYVDLRNMLLDIMRENNTEGVEQALKCFQQYEQVNY